ncbi:hypothetical protein HYV43_00350 [Candidatus Micrarchaeota archaeon]|nr:hypothetical protein [Candidatus Micrarchaeota archaeon]
MELVVRMSGAVEIVLEKLVERGYFKTKSEALRAGVLELGREYHLFEDPEVEKALVVKKIRQLEQQEKEGNAKFTKLDDVIKEAGLRRNDFE